MRHNCGEHAEVKDTRPIKNGTFVRRRRYCPRCKIRFTTHEISAEEFSKLMKIKKSFVKLKAAIRKLNVD